MSLLGKENQTLLGHVTDCLTAMNARLRHDEEVLRTVCADRLHIDWAELEACLRFAAVMHDIGKATDKWQEQQEARIRTKSNRSLITHALSSAFITGTSLRLPSDSVNTPKHAMTLAILGHHGQLHKQSFSSSSSGNGASVTLLDAGWQQLSELAKTASGINFADFPTGRSIELSKMKARFEDWKVLGKIPNTRHEALRFKGTYCLMASLLRSCDSIASKCATQVPIDQASFQIPGGPFLPDFYLMAKLGEWFSEWKSVHYTDVLQGKSPNTLQQRANELDGLFDLLNAGCGEGKTVLALRYAQELMAAGKVNRVIFTLPTRFTSNNMHKDFRQKYGLSRELVGLHHGDSLQFLRQETVEEEQDSVRELHYLDNFYHRPVTISTVDHLLMSFYHGYKYADWAFGNILQSVIIFDELHHYETLTVKAINEALKVLRLLGIPHLIMTATIPTTRIKTLNQRLPGEPQGKYQVLVSDGREEAPPAENTERRLKEAFVFRKVDEPMVARQDQQTGYIVSDTLLNDVLAHQNLCQIVFVNQVEKAKSVAKAIFAAQTRKQDCPVICYHAEFIGQDRNRKEEQIRKAFALDGRRPCILVATQIAELSLDISADRMYSEIAPLDDIVQRGGRLNRNGVTWTNKQGDAYEMTVFRLDFDNSYALLPYVKLKEHLAKFPVGTPHLLQRSWDILQEGETYRFDRMREWVNALYDQDEPLTYLAFQDAIHEDTVFGSKPQDRFSEDGKEDGGKIPLRTKEYETFDVVPEEFEGQLTESVEHNRRFLLKINESKYFKARHQDNLIVPHTVSIRIFKRRGSDDEYESREYMVLKRHYSYDFGVDFENDPDYEAEDDASPPRDGGNIF